MRFLITGLACIIFAVLPIRPAPAQTLHFVTEPFQPFNYDKDGKAAGAMVEVVQSTCVKIGVTCKIEVMPWRRALLLSQEGDADGVFSVLRLPEREEKFHITIPIIESAYVLFALTASNFVYRDPSDLAGHTIGVYGPSGTSITLNALMTGVRNAKVIVETDNTDALRLLSGGGYGENGLVMINRDVANYIEKKTGIENLREVVEIKKIQYCIAFSKKVVNEKMFLRFEDALKAQMKDGTVKTILDKYKLKQAN
jgi:polar amino acid transport system substrate-binding protein